MSRHFKKIKSMAFLDKKLIDDMIQDKRMIFGSLKKYF